jgi:hypothetical protein
MILTFSELIEPFNVKPKLMSAYRVYFLDRINRQLWFKAQVYRAGKYVQARQSSYRFAQVVVELCHPYDVDFITDSNTASSVKSR